MRALHYERPVHLDRLHDELLAALPALRPQAGRPVLAVQGTPAEVWLLVPDDADEPSIAAIVEAHDPTPPAPQPALTEQLATILASATELSQATRDALVAALRGEQP